MFLNESTHTHGCHLEMSTLLPDIPIAEPLIQLFARAKIACYAQTVPMFGSLTKALR